MYLGYNCSLWTSCVTVFLGEVFGNSLAVTVSLLVHVKCYQRAGSALRQQRCDSEHCRTSLYTRMLFVFREVRDFQSQEISRDVFGLKWTGCSLKISSHLSILQLLFFIF